MMSWDFWQSALAGELPETTPGRPHEGFYLYRKRVTIKNPNPTVGGPRKKVIETFEPVAIWCDEMGWQCQVGRVPNNWWLNDAAQIDEDIFSRCCRNPITKEDYEFFSGIELEVSDESE